MTDALPFDPAPSEITPPVVGRHGVLRKFRIEKEGDVYVAYFALGAPNQSKSIIRYVAYKVTGLSQIALLKDLLHGATRDEPAVLMQMRLFPSGLLEHNLIHLMKVVEIPGIAKGGYEPRKTEVEPGTILRTSPIPKIARKARMA